MEQPQSFSRDRGDWTVVRVRRTGDDGWGVVIQRHGTHLLSYHESREDAEAEARRVAEAERIRLQSSD